MSTKAPYNSMRFTVPRSSIFGTNSPNDLGAFAFNSSLIPALPFISFRHHDDRVFFHQNQEYYCPGVGVKVTLGVTA
jgi:hypothetical protein